MPGLNIFQQLDNYIRQNSSQTDGDILSESKDDQVLNMLSSDEYKIYESIQKSDRQRLLRFG